MYINEISLEHKSLSYGNNPEYLILHHADMNGSIQEVNKVHLNNGWSMIGYNYYVRKDGSIWKGRPEEAIGANCYGYNDKSISICAEGNYETDYMTSAMKASIIALGQDIEGRYGNKLKVAGHKELYSTDCPGSNYPLGEIKNSIINKNLSFSAGDFVPNGSIKQLQELIGATADGVPGPQTLSCCPTLEAGSSGDIVKWLQYVLRVSVDGQFGNETKKAVMDYQKLHSLSEDGIVGTNTWEKILGLS